MILFMAYPTVVTLRQVRAQIEADHAYYDSFLGSLHRPTRSARSSSSAMLAITTTG